MSRTLKGFQHEDPTQYFQRLRDLDQIVDSIVGKDLENPKIAPLTLIKELSANGIMTPGQLGIEAQALFEEAQEVFRNRQLDYNEIRLAIIYSLSNRGFRE